MQIGSSTINFDRREVPTVITGAAVTGLGVGIELAAEHSRGELPFQAARQLGEFGEKASNLIRHAGVGIGLLGIAVAVSGIAHGLQDG